MGGELDICHKTRSKYALKYEKVTHNESTKW